MKSITITTLLLLVAFVLSGQNPKEITLADEMINSLEEPSFEVFNKELVVLIEAIGGGQTYHIKEATLKSGAEPYSVGGVGVKSGGEVELRPAKTDDSSLMTFYSTLGFGYSSFGSQFKRDDDDKINITSRGIFTEVSLGLTHVNGWFSVGPIIGYYSPESNTAYDSYFGSLYYGGKLQVKFNASKHAYFGFDAQMSVFDDSVVHIDMSDLPPDTPSTASLTLTLGIKL